MPKAQRTHGIEDFDFDFFFKAYASTSFEILVQLQLGFVWQRARKMTLTNP